MNIFIDIRGICIYSEEWQRIDSLATIIVPLTIISAN